MNVGKYMIICVLFVSFCIFPVNTSALLRLQDCDVPLDIQLKDISGGEINHFQNDLYKNALQNFEKAFLVDDSMPEVNYMMGVVHWKMGNNEKVLNILEKTLDLMKEKSKVSGRDRMRMLRISSLELVPKLYDFNTLERRFSVSMSLSGLTGQSRTC